MPALIHQGKGEKIRVAEPLRDLGRGGGGGVSGGRIARHGLLEVGRHQHVALLDAVRLLMLEHTLSAREPPCRARRVAVEQKVDAEPERASHGRERLPAVEVGAVSAFERALLLLIAADHVGGGREQLQVLGGERGSAIGASQRPVRVRPGALLEERATALEIIGHQVHHCRGSLVISGRLASPALLRTVSDRERLRDPQDSRCVPADARRAALHGPTFGRTDARLIRDEKEGTTMPELLITDGGEV